MKKITLSIFLLITSLGFAQDPAVGAPAPTRNAANVISLFSNTYTNVPVNTWHTDWSVGSLEELAIAGNDVKKYTALSFVGVETTGPNMINATSMLYFHIDAWTPNMTTFRVKLVDFGADGAFAGGDDVEHEMTFENPQMNAWNSYDIPLSDFVGLTTKAHIAQLIISGNPAGAGTVYIDNVYFSNEALPNNNPTEPLTAAPTPTRDASTVISMFSNAYTNVPVNTWKTDWSVANLEEVMVQGNDTKKYTALSFVGIETVDANQINANSMLYFHVDAWTPNMTLFKVKLVDFGADGAFGGGDDVEHELSFTPTISEWNSYDIPLSNFTGLITKGHIAQLIFSGNPSGSGIVYIDNVYFSSAALGINNFESSKIKMYPNPVANNLNIENDTTIDTIEVYNVLGQKIIDKNVRNQSLSLDVSQLQNGVYIIKTNSAGKITTSRIIKE